MVCHAPYLQNELGDSRFFYVYNIILTFSTCSQSLKKKIITREILGANVLNWVIDFSRCTQVEEGSVTSPKTVCAGG